MFEIKISSRIILYILFIYQLYDIFNDFFHYNYSIELNFGITPRILPSITICIDKKHNLHNKYPNWKNPFGNQTIVCVYVSNLTEIFIECKEEKVYLRYRHKEICLTFFNNKTENYNFVQNKSIIILLASLIYNQQKVIIHPPDTASHFETNNVFVSYGYQNTILNIKQITSFTLPKPYSTDCQDYSKSAVSSLLSRSQSYCMFEYMRKEEFNQCGKNLYWNQYVIDIKDQGFKFKNESLNECIVKFNYEFLSRLCKIDCIIEKYTVSSLKYSSNFYNSIAEIPIVKQYNINLLYKSKLNKVQLCSNIGGLISMYFGLSMIDMIIIMSTKILYIRMVIMIKIIISIVFNYLIKTMFYIMMLYQLIMIIQTYIENNKEIKISFSNEIKFDKFALVIEPLIDFLRNEKFYPEFKENYNNLKYAQEKYHYIHNHIYNIFLKNLTSFVFITRLFDRKIECMMEFDNNIQLDCGPIILSKINFEVNSIKLYYNIPADHLINSTHLFNLKQISIILRNYDKYINFTNAIYIKFYNSIFLSYLPNEQNFIFLYSNFMNTIIVEPTYYRRLTHFGRQCDPRDKSLFDDSLTDDCIMDCFQKRSIDAFNCIPFKRTFGFIRWKKDLLENNHILCNQSYNEEIEINTFIRKCINECQFDCELGLYKITPFYDYNPVSRNNDINIQIIPRSNLIVQYEEQYVMDGWELIYQLGGVVGMWVGWSALSIASILKYLFENNIIKNDFFKIIFNINKMFISLNIYFRKFTSLYLCKFKTVFFTLFVNIKTVFFTLFFKIGSAVIFSPLVFSNCLINCLIKYYNGVLKNN